MAKFSKTDLEILNRIMNGILTKKLSIQVMNIEDKQVIKIIIQQTIYFSMLHGNETVWLDK